MGYNRIEREQLRRRQPRPRNDEKHRATTVKRFKFYIERRLTDRKPGKVAELAKAWAQLTNYDLDLAQRWWDAGMDPSGPDQLVKAIEASLRIEDLGKVIYKGRTVAECLQAGNSLAWCMAALHWRRPA